MLTKIDPKSSNRIFFFFGFAVLVLYAVYIFTPERPGGLFFFKQYSFFTIGHIDLYYALIEAESSKVLPSII